MEFRVNMQLYDGPMDLLLYLVRKHELDIAHLPLFPVIQQYMDFISILEYIDYAKVGEFASMAAWLVELKSQLVLPGSEEIEEEEVPEPKKDFVAHLLEYKRYRDAAECLEIKRQRWQLNYPRMSNDLPRQPRDAASDPIRQVELWDLVSAFGRIVREAQAQPQTKIIYEDTPIHVFMQRIQDRLKSQGSTSFTDLFMPGMHRTALIGTFLGTMELIRHFGVVANQYELFGEIWITKGENWTENLDLSQIDSYDNTAAA